MVPFPVAIVGRRGVLSSTTSGGLEDSISFLGSFGKSASIFDAFAGFGGLGVWNLLLSGSFNSGLGNAGVPGIAA